MDKALIISDGKPGHFNQSIALCQYLGLDYEVVEVAYKSRTAKALSYTLDCFGIHTESLFTRSIKPQTSNFKLVVSTGSTTYYANKLLAKQLKLPNVAILHPKGYRLDFDRILCPFYDHPPRRATIVELPLNLCAADPDFFRERTEDFKQRHIAEKSAVGIIIGGSNAVSTMDSVQVEQWLEDIFEQTKGMERWVTTSRRTPAAVEAVIDSFEFDYKLINSRDSYNPIPAFIQLCDRLFVTSDSASMISECASFGSAKVEVLMNHQLKTPNKFEELIRGLEARGAVHVFDGSLGEANSKIDLAPLLREAMGGLL